MMTTAASTNIVSAMDCDPDTVLPPPCTVIAVKLVSLLLVLVN